MRFYTPVLAAAVFLPAQERFEEKFGGLPWGFPASLWPCCRQCGKPMSHLMQLAHHPDRLNLGAVGRVLLLFQCFQMEHVGDCETWSPASGANAVLILDAVATGLTEAPAGAFVQPEARVLSWEEGCETIAPEVAPAFFDADRWTQLPAECLVEAANGSKLGGLPDWIQYPESPGAPYRFAGQFADYHSISVLQDRAARQVSLPEGLHWEQNGTLGQLWANFGMGIGYLFVNPDPEAPAGRFLWQCG